MILNHGLRAVSTMARSYKKKRNGSWRVRNYKRKLHYYYLQRNANVLEWLTRKKAAVVNTSLSSHRTALADVLRLPFEILKPILNKVINFLFVRILLLSKYSYRRLTGPL